MKDSGCYIREAAMIVMANSNRKEITTMAMIHVACLFRCSMIARTGQPQCSQLSVSGGQSWRHLGQGISFINLSEKRFSMSC
jgi:hypothetical protein